MNPIGFNDDVWAAQKWLEIAVAIREHFQAEVNKISQMNLQDKKDFIAAARDALFLEENALTFLAEIDRLNSLAAGQDPENPEDKPCL